MIKSSEEVDNMNVDEIIEYAKNTQRILNEKIEFLIKQVRKKKIKKGINGKKVVINI